jgi:hypothetical protein
MDRACVEYGKACGIVSAVFQSLQTCDKQRGNVTLGGGGNDSTHKLLLLETGAGPKGRKTATLWASDFSKLS